MRLNASRLDPEIAQSPKVLEPRRQDSQVRLKAPCLPPELAEMPQAHSNAPVDFVAFLSEERGIDPGEAFALLCKLVAEYRTPVRREIDVLRLSA
ncbi:MAG: hypothetical protein ACOY0T_34205 [Myxococcota bacterium]